MHVIVPQQQGATNGTAPDAFDPVQEILIKKDIFDAINEVEHTGDFAYSGNVPAVPNPGLFIKDVGQVGLPMSPRDAVAIIDVCHRSPFGKGTETLVDTSVRKCWELNADQF